MGWIGVDFDGTLAYYEGDFTRLGKPIPVMVKRVKEWLAAGIEVRIFTARPFAQEDEGRKLEVLQAIDLWCDEFIGRRLTITNVKDHQMIELWDDRCVQVVRNTGLSLKEYMQIRPKNRVKRRLRG